MCLAISLWLKILCLANTILELVRSYLLTLINWSIVGIVLLINLDFLWNLQANFLLCVVECEVVFEHAENWGLDIPDEWSEECKPLLVFLVLVSNVSLVVVFCWYVLLFCVKIGWDPVVDSTLLDLHSVRLTSLSWTRSSVALVHMSGSKWIYSSVVAVVLYCWLIPSGGLSSLDGLKDILHL